MASAGEPGTSRIPLEPELRPGMETHGVEARVIVATPGVSGVREMVIAGGPYVRDVVSLAEVPTFVAPGPVPRARRGSRGSRRGRGRRPRGRGICNDSRGGYGVCAVGLEMQQGLARRRELPAPPPLVPRPFVPHWRMAAQEEGDPFALPPQPAVVAPPLVAEAMLTWLNQEIPGGVVTMQVAPVPQVMLIGHQAVGGAVLWCPITEEDRPGLALPPPPVDFPRGAYFFPQILEPTSGFLVGVNDPRYIGVVEGICNNLKAIARN